MISVGEVDIEGLNLIVKFVLIATSIFILIVLMNLLISIIGDTFDRVQSEKDIADAYSLIDLILELEILLRNNRKKSLMKYI